MGLIDWLLPGKKSSGLGFTPGGDTPNSYGPYGYAGTWPYLLPSTRIDYKAEAGDPLQNAIIMASVQWICRTFPEARLRVMARAATGPAEEVDDHNLTTLLDQPNPWYNGLLLWQATLLSYNVDGNAYWIKARQGGPGGLVAELWYEPHMTIRPVWPDDGSEFIAGYQVLRCGRWSDPIPRSEVVHFKNGMDPANPRRGLSPLASALREIFTDNEAANFSASLLRNMGIPGVVISPAGPDVVIDDPEGLKKAMIAKYGGDRRGEPLIMQGPTKIDMLSFSPEQLNLEKLRNLPEERITALLGIPAVVAGLGSGLDHSTYSNQKDARAAAYDSNILPTQRLLAAQLNADLLPELSRDPRREYVEFDISKVPALSEDQDALFKRLSLAYKTGWIKRSEARSLSGQDLTNDTNDEVYFTDIPVGSENLRVDLDEPTDRMDEDELDDLEKDDQAAADEATPGKSRQIERKMRITQTPHARAGARQLEEAIGRTLDDVVTVP